MMQLLIHILPNEWGDKNETIIIVIIMAYNQFHLFNITSGLANDFTSGKVK